jgi:peptide/nickel transport system substrate-binding protein
VKKRNRFSRRGFLHLSAVAASGAVLGACSPGQQSDDQSDTEGGGKSGGKGSATRPIEAASRLKEAPMLRQMVDAGDIPPLEERLPEKPYVVPHRWLTSGKYGGTMRWNSSDAWGTTHFVQESMYGHSLLRWLNDGLDIGPGLAESWESNDDASEWTFRFRKGLRWSDGEPWTTADIMYWWEDMVLNEEHPSPPPFELISAKGTVAKLAAPDDETLTVTFDTPAPLLPGLVACWVKRGIGPADWMQPRHYLEQFHPEYNDQAGEDWVETHESKKDFALNSECPTMTGWKLKSYKEGSNAVWERNPFYWCVSKDGAQLPYMDTITVSEVQDPEIQKLQFTEGRVDYVHGGFTPLTIGDVSGLKQAESRNRLRVWFWDSGSGTGSVFFFNYDYEDEKLRELFRKPKFRQALSHAFDRDEAQKAIYFNTGEKTTGTTSRKSVEFVFNEEGRQRYEEWRDAYVQYDPGKAKSMLDELGVEDQDGDGKREMPDGSKLVIRLDYPADTSEEHIRKNEFLKRDWDAIGIDTRMNPVPPEGLEDQWNIGKLMSKTAWEVSDGPNSLVNPTWLLPLEPSRWAPLHGQGYILKSDDPKKVEDQKDEDPWKRQPPWLLPEEGDPIQRLYDIYAKATLETDGIKRHKLVWDILKVHVEDGPFFMGVVANYPRIVLVHEDMRNVPRQEELVLNGFVNTWIHPTPAVYDPEAYYWENPEEHSQA